MIEGPRARAARARAESSDAEVHRRLAEFDFEGQLGRLIRFSHDGLQRAVLGRLSDSGFADLGSAHVRVLVGGLAGPQRAAELASRGPMTRQALNHLLTHLLAEGYLRRDRVDATPVVALTAKGTAAAAIAVLGTEEFSDHYRDRVGAATYEAFETVLRLMAADFRETERSDG